MREVAKNDKFFSSVQASFSSIKASLSIAQGDIVNLRLENVFLAQKLDKETSVDLVDVSDSLENTLLQVEHFTLFCTFQMSKYGWIKWLKMGKAIRDPCKHLAKFYETCSMCKSIDVTEDRVKLILFGFSLIGQPKYWLQCIPNGTV